jgi:hypothetical protein
MKFKFCIYRSEDVDEILKSIRELKEALNQEGVKKYDVRLWYTYERVRTDCEEQEIDDEVEEEENND